jgi:uncharacterized membrane protein YeaQ/YmgE (transglycosylase-associated protein family)
MKKTNETDSLNELILFQEQQYDTDLRLLKEQLHIAYESVKPINLIKNLVHDVTTSSEIKNDIGTNIMGLVTGFISKKLLVGNNSNRGIFKTIFGTILQFGIANVIAKHSDDIKAFGTTLLNSFFKRKKL